MEQIEREYPVDGMCFDGPQYYRSCYCPWCRESFREFSGLDLPPIRKSQPSEGQLAFHPDLAPGLDWDDPAIHVYFDWVAKMDLELVASLNATIKGIRNIPLLAHGSSIMHRTFKAAHLQHALQVDGCLFETGEDFMHRYVVAQLTASVDRAMWSYTGALATHPRVFENVREYAAEAYAAVAAGGTPILSFGNRVYFDKRGDREAEVLREYVAGGGGLVVTGLTGTRNERGLERPDFAVADVLGVCYEGYSAEIYDRYLRIDAGPALVLNSYGKGRTAYFASNMATIYARPPERRSRLFDRYPPIRRLVARAVQWAARRPSPIQVKAHPALTATLMSKTGTPTLHLVNYAGPRHDKAHTVTEAFMPISDVPVAVPQIEEYEAVAIELAKA